MQEEVTGTISADARRILARGWPTPGAALHLWRPTEIARRHCRHEPARVTSRATAGTSTATPGYRGAPAAGGPLVVPLGSAAHLAGACGPDQARVGENLQMVGNVALIAAQSGGELADGRLALAEGEQQPVTRRMTQRLELLWRGDLGGVM